MDPRVESLLSHTVFGRLCPVGFENRLLLAPLDMAVISLVPETPLAIGTLLRDGLLADASLPHIFSDGSLAAHAATAPLSAQRRRTQHRRFGLLRLESFSGQFRGLRKWTTE